MSSASHGMPGGSVNCYFMNTLAYGDARAVQDFAVAQRVAGHISDAVFFCEHPAVITLGKRLRLDEVTSQAREWRQKGIGVEQTDRGGAMTYHGPGQLLIYPVVSLPFHRMGVRVFVHTVLEALIAELALPNLSIGDTAPGIWYCANGEKRKIASVGLRISHGVTNHGFSVNLSGDLDAFSEIPVCGVANAKVTSFEELTGRTLAVEEFAWRMARRLRACFSA